MTFSVVIPAYNGGMYIERALISALNQTRKADEIIVYDDNSMDSTREICTQYSTVIKYIFNEAGPSGFVNSWNKAVSSANSDYITILHQDDILYPGFIEEAEKAIFKYPGIRHLFSLCDYISNIGYVLNDGEEAVKDYYPIGDTILFSGQEYIRAYQRSYSGRAHIHRCPGVITHKSIFESGYYYNKDAGHIADDDFFYRIGQYTNVVGIIKSLAAYRIHEGSITGNLKDYELTKKLAEDYLYQIRQWQNSDYMKLENRRYFNYWAFKYLFRLYYYAWRLHDADLSQFAEDIRKELYTFKDNGSFFQKRLFIWLMRFMYNLHQVC